MSAELDDRRLAVVREHMESENVQDFDRTIATFAAPRYELMATGEVFDGEDEVRSYFARSRADFPDQRNENSVLRTVADGVVVEFDLLGTHARARHVVPVADARHVPGRGRRRRDRLRARVHFDTASIRQQLLGASADPA